MTDTASKDEVVVTDIRMPFGSMVVFMVKWAIASIPAFVILVVVGGLGLEPADRYAAVGHHRITLVLWCIIADRIGDYGVSGDGSVRDT